MISFAFRLTILIGLSFSVTQAGRGRLLWSDEFDSFVDFQNNWNAEIGGHGWGNNELQYYTAVNSRLENSNLIIEARREQLGNNQYTSSRLISKNAFKYGVFEMRARLPKGRGTWPAFWLLGAKRPLQWPDDGEIDVMEHVGYDPNRIHATIHCKKYNHVLGTQVGTSTVLGNAFDDYHTYTLEWSANKIEVFVDGNRYFTYNKQDNSYDTWPFDNTHNIILNLAIGGDWGGVQGVDNTIFPVQYRIDYVRQYEYVEDAPANVVSVRKVALKAKANNKFVCAMDFGNSALIANQLAVGVWEKFDMTTYSDGFVTFKADVNNKFVSADNYGNSPLIANKDTGLDWEKFFIVNNGDGTHSFRAKVNNKYVAAENYGNDPLIADRDGIDDWEKFYIEYQ